MRKTTKKSLKNNNEVTDVVDDAPADAIQTFDEDGNPEYNPKYQGRLKSTSSGMFPNYHSNYEEKKVQKTLKKQEMIENMFRCCRQIKSAKEALPDPECSPASSKEILTVAALSFHSVFEGMAIGLESSVVDVWKVFAAVAVHKFVMTFCVGMELVNSESNRLCSYITYMIIFCLVTPFGTTIGVIVHEVGRSYMTIGLLQGLSAGTILYVIIFEILQREKTKRKIPGLVQLVFIALGFAIMLCIEILGN